MQSGVTLQHILIEKILFIRKPFFIKERMTINGNSTINISSQYEKKKVYALKKVYIPKNCQIRSDSKVIKKYSPRLSIAKQTINIKNVLIFILYLKKG
ncbi:hypothetical protein I794_09140 [Listeria monocytogenes SHL002]|nr:hypothetical protein I794_09140 [Listeria monocytogenes SHL002]